MRTEKNRIALIDASRNAETALKATFSPEFAHVPADERSTWAMAAIIHCDLCRLVVAYAECELEGVARLLWLGDIASKLCEARNWFNKAGTTSLQEISKRKQIGPKAVNTRIDDLKKTYGVNQVNRYVDYRNKLGHHYDVAAITSLRSFGQNDAEEFFKILALFVQFSGAWAQLTKEIIQSENVAKPTS